MTDQSRRLPQPGAVAVTIRVAHREDGPVLQDVERRAGEQFRSIGMDAVADDEPASLTSLAAYAEAGRSWVAVDDGGSIVGYVLVDLVDGCAHLEQISVLPDHQGIGIGQLLLAQVKDWARTNSLKAVTLITFSDVPWNRPLYEHLGFRVLRNDQIGAGLRGVRAAEAARGLDPATRVVMRTGV